MKIKEQNEQHMVLKGGFVNKVVLDKVNQNVNIESLFGQQVIPFSEVTRVQFDYITQLSGQQGFPKDNWRVSIIHGGRLTKIDQSGDRRETYDLGRRISDFIGAEFMDNSAEDEYHLKVRRAPFDVSPRGRYGRGR